MFWPGYLFLKFTESCLGLFWIFELVNMPFLLLSFLFFLTFLCSVFSTLLVPKSPPRFQGPVHKPTGGSRRHSAQPNCELTTQKNLKEKIMAWSVYCVVYVFVRNISTKTISLHHTGFPIYTFALLTNACMQNL